MTREQNVRSILESNFAGFKDEIIDVAVKNIMALSENDVLDKIRNEITMLRTFNRQNVIEIIDKHRIESENA